MDLMGVGPVIEPIRLIGGIPGTLGKSVAPLLFSETSQDLGGLRAASISASFELVGAHSEQNFWRPIIGVPHSLHSLGDSGAGVSAEFSPPPLAMLR